MTTQEYNQICIRVCEISRKAGKYISDQLAQVNPSEIEQKGHHNYVTYVDKSAEILIVNDLRELLPNSGFIAEENTAGHESQKFKWIIDPLDGTTNFIHKVPLFCVSIALMEGDEIVVGVVYEVNLDECFYAWKGGKAMLNKNEIFVSPIQDFDNSLLATGFPYYDYGKLEEYVFVFKHFMKHTAGLRRLGSAAADLAYVACGRFEGFYEYGLNSWDVAAGAFIVQMAGGVVTDFSGGNEYLFGREIIAGNPYAHPEMRIVFEELFGRVSNKD
ncbi:MAG: inositol monophosphatase [Lentimicrobium sp.]|nr:inositol monophosphatase [Lentimicrobium sp.]